LKCYTAAKFLKIPRNKIPTNSHQKNEKIQNIPRKKRNIPKHSEEIPTKNRESKKKETEHEISKNKNKKNEMKCFGIFLNDGLTQNICT
jgi:hypothetical protein